MGVELGVSPLVVLKTKLLQDRRRRQLTLFGRARERRQVEPSDGTKAAVTPARSLGDNVGHVLHASQADPSAAIAQMHQALRRRNVADLLGRVFEEHQRCVARIVLRAAEHTLGHAAAVTGDCGNRGKAIQRVNLVGAD